MTINTDIENLRFPIGKFNPPEDISPEDIKSWIDTIENFPFEVFRITNELTEEQLLWAYRPEGWSIRQLVHHCTDSHMNSFIRFKWALTEDTPTIKAYFEDKWAKLPDSRSGPVTSAQTMLDGLHERWVFLLRSLTNEDLKKTFIHPESGKEIPLDQNIALYAWHCKHHLAHMLLALEFEGKYRQQ